MNLTKLPTLLFCCVFCSSCAPYLYLATPPNMPLPENKGEVKANMYACTEGGGIQASYAIDSHCVVFINAAGQSIPGSSITIDNTTYSSSIANFQGDIGAGYFKKIGSSGKYEFLGGIGYGGSTSQNVLLSGGPEPNDITINDVNGGFIHEFVQGDIGFVHKNFEIGLGLRLSNINPDASYETWYPNQNLVKTVEYYTQIEGDALFVEPMFIASIGSKRVKFNLSAGLSDKLFGSDINRQYGQIYQGFNVFLGLSFNFNRNY